jgi:hypothetical protein
MAKLYSRVGNMYYKYCVKLSFQETLLFSRQPNIQYFILIFGDLLYIEYGQKLGHLGLVQYSAIRGALNG